MRQLVARIVVLVVAFGAGAAAAAAGQEWGYSGAHGPEHWSELSEKFMACGTGRNQSPIDLTNFIEAELPPLVLTYATRATELINLGHTVQVTYAAGSTLALDGRIFELKQFHFHAPSENLIEGRSFPLEAHLVHADADGNLAVVAVMFEEGPANALLAELWARVPNGEGERTALQGGDVSRLLPADLDYYRFNGSLTTPPCTEGVRWLVLKRAMTASADQVKTFAGLLPESNNRPVQPVNARPVLR